METFRDFLRAYNKSDIYMVSSAGIPGWPTVRSTEAPGIPWPKSKIDGLRFLKRWWRRWSFCPVWAVVGDDLSISHNFFHEQMFFSIEWNILGVVDVVKNNVFLGTFERTCFGKSQEELGGKFLPKVSTNMYQLWVSKRYLNFLDTHNFWMGRGGSKSVVASSAKVQKLTNVSALLILPAPAPDCEVHYDDQERSESRNAWT